VPKFIMGADLNRQPLPSAYIRVIGQTQNLALRRAKKLGSVLHEKLPDAILRVPQYTGQDGDGMHSYDVVLAFSLCAEDKAKSEIAKLVLKGSV
jgi:hypothetical protein